MAVSALEMELEALPEFEFEAASEWEGGLGENETEQFFGALAGLARRASASPALRRIGLQAARSALSGLGPVGGVVGGLLPQSELGELGEFETLGELGQMGEFESLGELGELGQLGEFETLGELGELGEYEANPLRRAYPDAEALMEHLGHAASEAATEEEAEAFIGALIPLAASLIPKVAPVVMKAAPQLIKAASNVAGSIMKSPTVKPLVRAVPNIVRRTVADVSRQVAQGKPITTQGVVRTFAGNTAKVLGGPRPAVRVYGRSRALDRRYHAGARRGRTGLILPANAMTRGRPAPCQC
jgi:hypothetical protein